VAVHHQIDARPRPAILCLCLIAWVAAACGPAHRRPATGAAAGAPSAAANAVDRLTLEFLAEAILPSGQRHPELDESGPFGSVSGLVRDEATGEFLSVNDDREGTRVAWLDIRYAGGQLSVTPTRQIALREDSGVEHRLATASDLEAIVALPDGSFVASEEGHVERKPGRTFLAGTWQPALVQFRGDGVVTRVTEFPPMFRIGSDGDGVRDNQGFEALARAPSGHLVSGLEQPLYGDATAADRNGRPFSGGRGGPGRLVEWVLDRGAWVTARQWIYPIEPTPAVAGFDTICADGENGLTDLLALSTTTFLSLERSCQQNAQTGLVRNTARIFAVDISAADDVSGTMRMIDSPPAGTPAPRPARKRLLLDLDAVIPRLSPALERLENFEALAFGPPTPAGGRTLLVVSDDNFRPTQKGAFLLFAIKP
jgi:hypothetical protein